ncbi:MAG: sigma factor-like helix-turn-helix DNA-binding protein [Verrucomicrobiia bacterium]
MDAQLVVECLLDLDRLACIKALLGEASVHLPPRGTLWIATFTDETGRQVWKSTGHRDRTAAQAVADEWAAEAKRKRTVQGGPPRKPTIRVRPGSGEHAQGLLSQSEVAALLRISERTVREIERRAFEKLRNHPALRRFWREWQTGKVGEAIVPPTAEWDLSTSEITALLSLARMQIERHALMKLIAFTGAPRR